MRRGLADAHRPHRPPGRRPVARMRRHRRAARKAVPRLRGSRNHAVPRERELGPMWTLLFRPAGAGRRLYQDRGARHRSRRPAAATALVRRGAWSRGVQTPRRRGHVPAFGDEDIRRRFRPPPGPPEALRVTRQLELSVDRIKCDGRGLCAEILPEMIRLDSWGYPIIAPGPIPDHLIGLAQRAVDDCPVLAIALRRAETKRQKER